MMELILSSFWTWLGTSILLLIVFAGIVDIIDAIKRK